MSRGWISTVGTQWEGLKQTAQAFCFKETHLSPPGDFLRNPDSADGHMRKAAGFMGFYLHYIRQELLIVKTVSICTMTLGKEKK